MLPKCKWTLYKIARAAKTAPITPTTDPEKAEAAPVLTVPPVLVDPEDEEVPVAVGFKLVLRPVALPEPDEPPDEEPVAVAVALEPLP